MLLKCVVLHSLFYSSSRTVVIYFSPQKGYKKIAKIIYMTPIITFEEM